jgi:LacI family transcriptional regulator
MPSRPVTLKEVAAATGVSVSTVSRVLRDTRNVDQEIRERVLEAAEALGYQGDPVARALRGGLSGAVGCVVPRVTNPFFPALIERLEKELSRDGRQLLLSHSYDDTDRERIAIQNLLARRIDGLVVVPCDEHASKPAIETAAKTTRTVQIDRFATHNTDFVGVDNDAGIAQAVAHLLSSGRRRLAFIGGAPGTSASKERHVAFARHAAQYAVAVETDGSFSADWGATATTRLFSRGNRPDALVCAADVIAIGALSALRQLGVAVPQAVAVIGFDGIGATEITYPPLTTVSQPFDQIARTAIAWLGEPTDASRGQTRELIRPNFIKRESA